MSPVIKFAVAGLLLFLIGAATEQNAFAQGSTSVPLERDPATQGSIPYKETVMRFLSRQEPKIVGGKPAELGMFPWQVSLGVSWIGDNYRAHFCGGSVYAEGWIITAAHCVEQTTPAQIIITAGTIRLVPATIRRNVKRIIVHKAYDSRTHDNDIALIEMLDPLPITDQIKAVALLTPDVEEGILVEGAGLSVTGWGATQEGGTAVRNLRYLDNIPLVPRSFCNEPLSYDGRITENMICAGVTAGGRDSCQGDSGGPLTTQTLNTPKLAGVVSWGDGCARTNKVGVYTRVAKYVDWIRACVSNPLMCNQ